MVRFHCVYLTQIFVFVLFLNDTGLDDAVYHATSICREPFTFLDTSKNTNVSDTFEATVEESHELNYDSPSKPYSIAVETVASTCGKDFCRMGCVCDSLNFGVPWLDHCQLPACMFQCSCIDSDEAETPPQADKVAPSQAELVAPCQTDKVANRETPSSIKVRQPRLTALKLIAGKLSVVKTPRRSRARSTEGQIVLVTNNKRSDKKLLQQTSSKLKHTSVDGQVVVVAHKTLSDKKLLQQCRVHLTRMDLYCCRPSTQQKFHQNPKLYLKAYVPVIKAKISSTQKVYCMNHGRYECSCLKLNKHRLKSNK